MTDAYKRRLKYSKMNTVQICWLTRLNSFISKNIYDKDVYITLYNIYYIYTYLWCAAMYGLFIKIIEILELLWYDMHIRQLDISIVMPKSQYMIDSIIIRLTVIYS